MEDPAHPPGSLRLRVETWDDDLALRLPQELVDALDLREGDEIDLIPIGPRTFEIVKLPGPLTDARAEP